MQSIEVTGRSVEEATEEAAKQLGVSAKKLKVTVLEQTKGLFGKGNVRILAEAPEKASTKKAATEPAAEPPKEVRSGRKRAAVEEAAPEAEGQAEGARETQAGEHAAEVVATEEDARRVLEIVESVLAAGEFEVSARVASIGGRYVNVELDGQGKQLGYLVGKSGEVLNALQYLLNIIVSQKLKNGVRITLDANNYRQRREIALSKLAEDLAGEVRARKEEAVLDPLPAFERRIIHKALADIEGVTTYSEGEEPNRRVVIAPAD